MHLYCCNGLQQWIHCKICALYCKLVTIFFNFRPQKKFTPEVSVVFWKCGFLFNFVSDIAIFVLKRDVKLQLTNFLFNWLVQYRICYHLVQLLTADLGYVCYTCTYAQCHWEFSINTRNVTQKFLSSAKQQAEYCRRLHYLFHPNIISAWYECTSCIFVSKLLDNVVSKTGNTRIQSSTSS